MSDEPAYVKTFKRFTKRRFSIADIAPLEAELYGASDRSCGILMGAMVETALDSALKSVLRPDLSSDLADRLFGFEGPLGTFSAKIDFAYGLSLFGQKTKHDLGLIRLMRNEFAHCRLPLRFEMDAVSKVCVHLQVPDTKQKVHPAHFMSLSGAPEVMKLKTEIDEKHPKTRFITTCHSITYWLLDFARRTNHRTMQKSRLP